jgi:hypothetical protein
MPAALVTERRPRATAPRVLGSPTTTDTLRALVPVGRCIGSPLAVDGAFAVKYGLLRISDRAYGAGHEGGRRRGDGCWGARTGVRGSYALLSHTILGRWGWGRTLVMFWCCSLHSTPSSDRCFSFRSTESRALESSLLRLPACHLSGRSWLAKQPRCDALPIGLGAAGGTAGSALTARCTAGRLVGWLAG